MALVFYVLPLLLLFSCRRLVLFTDLFFFSSIFPKYFIIPIISGLTSFIPASKNKNDDVHPSPQNNKTQLLH